LCACFLNRLLAVGTQRLAVAAAAGVLCLPLRLLHVVVFLFVIHSTIRDFHQTFLDKILVGK